MTHILIVEDDAAIAEIERDYMVAEGMDAQIADNGNDGLALGLSGQFGLVILDVMLPGIDGFEVCRRLREQTDIPILMVTALQEDIDKIRGMGLGADSYIEKPFSPSVLVAYVKAALKRYQSLSGARPASAVVSLGDVSINTHTRQAFVRNKEVSLTRREYDLLSFFMLNPDIALSKETLYERVWGMDSVGDVATVAVHVNRLREKIEDDPSNPRHILTVWGVGYRFQP